jgi:hypothetical protein
MVGKSVLTGAFYKFLKVKSLGTSCQRYSASGLRILKTHESVRRWLREREQDSLNRV